MGLLDRIVNVLTTSQAAASRGVGPEDDPPSLHLEQPVTAAETTHSHAIDPLTEPVIPEDDGEDGYHEPPAREPRAVPEEYERRLGQQAEMLRQRDDVIEKLTETILHRNGPHEVELDRHEAHVLELLSSGEPVRTTFILFFLEIHQVAAEHRINRLIELGYIGHTCLVHNQMLFLKEPGVAWLRKHGRMI